MSEKVVLDDPLRIEKIDKKGMLRLCLKTHVLCREAKRLFERIGLPRKVEIPGGVLIRYMAPRNVIVAGMGGSSVGGEILRDLLRDVVSVPIGTCNDYELPAYADRDTLVFAVSYSGETEETLSTFVEAVKRGCMVVAVTSGGHLKSMCERLGLPCVTVPSGLPSRVALPYLFFPLLTLMEELGVASGQSKDLQETERVLKEICEENSPQTPLEENPAKRLAVKLQGTIPVIYGSRNLRAVARRWKTQLNENSKVPCRYEVFPELDHNEVEGWEAPESLTKRFSVVLLRDPDEPPRLKLRIEATKKLVLRKVCEVLEVHARGRSKLTKMFSLIQIGDLVSVYLAALLGVNPWPAEAISKIKTELREELGTVKRLEAEVERILRGQR